MDTQLTNLLAYDASIEKPDWSLLVQPTVMQSEDDDGADGFFGGPFVNKYGLDYEVVSGLFYGALGTILMPIVSLPLFSLNMFFLVSYLLLRPTFFQGEHGTDVVTFTSEEYFDDIVEFQVGGALGFYVIFLVGWLCYVYPTYRLVAGFSDIGTDCAFAWDYTIVAATIGAFFINLAIFAVSFYYSELFYSDWETPAELRYLD